MKSVSLQDSATFAFFVVLFSLVATRTEFGEWQQGPGMAFLLRTSSCFMLLVALVLKFRLAVSRRMIEAAAIYSCILLLSNLAGMSYFAVMGAFAVALGILLAVSMTEQARSYLARIINAYMLINIGGLLLAAGIYLSAGVYADLHHLAFPWSASRAGEFLGMPRLSGFQVEPGSYTNAMYAMVFLSSILSKNLLTRTNVTAVLSTLITFSAWSVIGVTIYFLATLFAGRSGKKVVANASTVLGRVVTGSVLALVVFGTVSWISANPNFSGVSKYFLVRFTSGEGSGSTALKFATLEAWINAFGTGMILPHSMTDTFCKYCISVQDLGLGFNLIFYLGIPLALGLLSVFLWRIATRHGISFLALSLPIFVSKFFYYDPLVWLILGVGIYSAPGVLKRTARPRRFPDLGQRNATHAYKILPDISAFPERSIPNLIPDHPIELKS